MQPTSSPPDFPSRGHRVKGALRASLTRSAFADPGHGTRSTGTGSYEEHGGRAVVSSGGVASSRQRNLTTSRDPVAPRHPARQPGGLSYSEPKIKIHDVPRATTERRSYGMNDHG
jgi:hypothetical protein